MEKFDIGNITLKIKFNTEELLDEIRNIAENEEIFDIYLRDSNELCISTEEDFYIFDLLDYVAIEDK